MTGVHTHTHTYMKFNLHGHSSPDWKRPPSPPSSFPPRLDLEAPEIPRTHIYIECEAPLQHHKNTDNDNDNNNTYYNFWDVQGGGGGGGGAATNIKVCGPLHKRLWNINGCVVIFLLLSPYLIHPTLVLQFPPSPTARTSRTRSRRSHFLFFITGTCCLFVFHHWKTQVRYPLLHHWKTLLLSPHLRNLGRWLHSHLVLVVYVVKTFFNFFENLKLFKKPQATFKSQNSMKYI